MLKQKALKLGISNRKNKRFFVVYVYDDKIHVIHFRSPFMIDFIHGATTIDPHI